MISIICCLIFTITVYCHNVIYGEDFDHLAHYKVIKKLKKKIIDYYVLYL